MCNNDSTSTPATSRSSQTQLPLLLPYGTTSFIGNNSALPSLSIVSTGSPMFDPYRLQLYQLAMHERLRLSGAASLLPCGPMRPEFSIPVSQQLQFPLLNYGKLDPRLIPFSHLHLPRPPEEPKPQHSYIGLIALAILSSPDKKLVLSDIYQYILDNYNYFRTRGPGWRNSIRHNLSLNDCFIKAGRSANGKGHYWGIHPANLEDFERGDFRRRKAQRKVRRHMGLAVDEEDSPSPPPSSPSPSWMPHHFPALTDGSPNRVQFGRSDPSKGTLSSFLDTNNSFSVFNSVMPPIMRTSAMLKSSSDQNNSSLDEPLSPKKPTVPTTVTFNPLIASALTSAAASYHAAAQALVEKDSRRRRQFDVASLLEPEKSKKRRKTSSEHQSPSDEDDAVRQSNDDELIDVVSDPDDVEKKNDVTGDDEDSCSDPSSSPVSAGIPDWWNLRTTPQFQQWTNYYEQLNALAAKRTSNQ